MIIQCLGELHHQWALESPAMHRSLRGTCIVDDNFEDVCVCITCIQCRSEHLDQTMGPLGHGALAGGTFDLSTVRMHTPSQLMECGLTSLMQGPQPVNQCLLGVVR